MAAADPPGVTHRELDLGEVRLDVAEAGEGPLVVCLHGFPEFWYSWRHQLPALAAAGFHAVAPDMRGYNRSSKPAGVGAYDVRRLARDVAELVRGCGARRATVIGHDWGGLVAWATAMRHPEVVERLVILNAPHPVTAARGLRHPDQLRRSWYVFAFQVPRLPEAAFRARDFAVLRAALRREPVRPGAFSDDDIGRYVEAMDRPGALTATVNYYRAAVRRDPRRRHADLQVIDAPVLVVWGEQDRHLRADLAEPDPRWVPNARVERLSDASHWVQNDRPERVNELLLDFLLAREQPPSP